VESTEHRPHVDTALANIPISSADDRAEDKGDHGHYRIRPNLNSDHLLLRALANADAAAILNSIIQPHRDAHELITRRRD
jgi:hypothetical protein